MIAAKALDDLKRLSRRRQTGGGEEEEMETVESMEDFQSRVNLYVAIQLQKASTSTRDSYKDEQVYQMRKETISEFLKATIQKKCKNADCGA